MLTLVAAAAAAADDAADFESVDETFDNSAHVEVSDETFDMKVASLVWKGSFAFSVKYF